MWPSDAIWLWWSWSTLVQVMTCCLTAPSHYLNQCWRIITKVQWCSSEGNFTWEITANSHWNQLENYFSKILSKFSRDQWVNGSEKLYASGALHFPSAVSDLPVKIWPVLYAYWTRNLTYLCLQILCRQTGIIQSGHKTIKKIQGLSRA